MNPVLTKSDYYSRWMAMEFGNRPQAWDSLDELEASCYRGEVAIRYCEVNSDRKAYGVPAYEARHAVWRMGGVRTKYRFSEQSPLDKVTIQGELAETEEGLYLAYSTVKAPMKALRNNLAVVNGFKALATLKSYLDPGDVDCLRDLVASYPGHIIEFGGYKTRVGVCNKRMIVWEVRAY